MEIDLSRLFATDLIVEAVDHAVGEVTCEEKLKRELKHWKTEKGGVGGADYCQQEGSIPLELVVQLHQQLQKTPLVSGSIYLHELLEGSSICFPEVKVPARNPELVARLERIQAQTDTKEYRRMVKNVDVSRSDPEFYSLGLEVQATNRQIWTVVNFIFTVVGAFLFGYFAAYFAGYSIPVCVSIGLIAGTVVFMADLYFLVRTDLVPPNYLRGKKPKGKRKND